ncbi:hypothetical protein CC2G_008160 [Coprinopsis cinerea AmutBmut pab1-1]|nr:hypothetical protein CC2G_008160 [Coprinopsis cinerea AmutBmut pab1-1]
MAKKNANTAAAKAAKKAKAQQKSEKREKKKVLKESGNLPNGAKSGSGKKGGKKNAEDSDDDLEAILAQMQKEWEAAHKVTEELVEGPPSRRANATLTACPNGGHLWCVGGEWFSEDGRAHFYNDTFRYTPEKDEWRKFVSPTCPGPRSAHAVCATPAGGGKLFLFGGEFSSLHQTSFHHYGDFWAFDVGTHSWDRIETKIRPSPRSGHRMAMWKHYVVLFGGFYDPGITTRYLNDLWVFDTQEYTWKQVEFKETELRPSPRSGFSFLPCPEGILLHGGYCKQYSKGKRPVGVMLEDTWLLKLSIPEASEAATSSSKAQTSKATPSASKSNKGNKGASKGTPLNLNVKWERRKRPSDAFAPSLRSGCTMALWSAKGMGVMFGGVTDEDKNEEVLESVFHNDLFGYQISGKGRWISLNLKQPKAKGKKKKKDAKKNSNNQDSGDENDEGHQPPAPPNGDASKVEADDPNLTVPIARYNAMLAVLKNTLYIYGGILEKGSKEYTLDDFYSLQLDKLDRFTCLKPLSFEIPAGEGESSSEDDDDDDDDEDSEDEDLDNGEFDDESEHGENAVDNDDDDDEAGEEAEVDDGSEGDDELDADDKPVKEKVDRKQKRKDKKDKKKAALEEAASVAIEELKEEVSELRQQASSFMNSAKDPGRNAEEALSTPLPGETLAMFYARSRDYWTQKAMQQDEGDNQGKELRRVGFALAEERYESYKPLLEEVEKILAEAGLNEEEMRMSAQAGAAHMAGQGQSRNRR